MNLPESVKIAGIVYRIAYHDKLNDVDLFGREPLLGQVDFLTRTIRIYKADRSWDDILHTILHEVVHAILAQLHITATDGEDLCENERVVDLLATGLTLFLQDNSFALSSPTSAPELLLKIESSSGQHRSSGGQLGGGSVIS